MRFHFIQNHSKFTKKFLYALIFLGYRGQTKHFLNANANEHKKPQVKRNDTNKLHSK